MSEFKNEDQHKWFGLNPNDEFYDAYEEAIQLNGCAKSLSLVHSVAKSLHESLREIAVAAQLYQMGLFDAQYSAVWFQVNSLIQKCSDPNLLIFNLVGGELSAASNSVVSWLDIAQSEKPIEEIPYFPSFHHAVIEHAVAFSEELIASVPPRMFDYFRELPDSDDDISLAINEQLKLAHERLGNVQAYFNRTRAHLKRELLRANESRRTTRVTCYIDDHESEDLTDDCGDIEKRVEILDELTPIKREKLLAVIMKLKQAKSVPVKGILLASHLEIESSTFFSWYAPRLKELGVKHKKGEGYYL